MDQQLKQRLVGVAVIFSLAVIFLPMLLDGSGNRSKQLKTTIPAPPSVPGYEIVEEKVIELKSKVEQLAPLESKIVDEVSDPADKVSAEEKITSPVEKNQESEPVETVTAVEPVPAKIKQPETVNVEKEVPKMPVGGTSWVIQVGSFSDKNKAYKQRDRLRNSALGAVFIEKFKHDGQLSYRVRMGPFITREKADIIKNKILAKYNIKGIVMHYEK